LASKKSFGSVIIIEAELQDLLDLFLLLGVILKIEIAHGDAGILLQVLFFLQV
jgi:hypothetical protein